MTKGLRDRICDAGFGEYWCTKCRVKHHTLISALMCHPNVEGEEKEVELPSVTPDELAIICKTVVELTEIRQRECRHLCVENFAAECFRNLLRIKKGEAV